MYKRQAHNVSELFLFGSFVKENFRSDSDIDFLVSFLPMDPFDYSDSYFALCEELEKITKRKVDVVTSRSLSNPYFIQEVERTKMLLYQAA